MSDTGHPIDRDVMFGALSRDFAALDLNALHALRVWWGELPQSSRPTYVYLRDLCDRLLRVQRDRDESIRRDSDKAYADAAAEK